MTRHKQQHIDIICVKYEITEIFLLFEAVQVLDFDQMAMVMDLSNKFYKFCSIPVNLYETLNG